jgi:hypothetical protein
VTGNLESAGQSAPFIFKYLVRQANAPRVLLTRPNFDTACGGTEIQVLFSNPPVSLGTREAPLLPGFYFHNEARVEANNAEIWGGQGILGQTLGTVARARVTVPPIEEGIDDSQPWQRVNVIMNFPDRNLTFSFRVTQVPAPVLRHMSLSRASSQGGNLASFQMSPFPQAAQNDHVVVSFELPQKAPVVVNPMEGTLRSWRSYS